jgi:hypothetical protein
MEKIAIGHQPQCAAFYEATIVKSPAASPQRRITAH